MADTMDRTGTRGRTAEEIRREIDETRAEMDQTVNELERKISPGQVLDRLLGDMGTDGESALRGMGETAKHHPVPVALRGLGLGWLAIERMTGSTIHSHRARQEEAQRRYGTDERAEGRVGPYRGWEVGEAGWEGSADGSGGMASGVKEKLADAK